MDKVQQEACVRFGREVKRLRRLARYTQDRLANEVGMSQGHIGNIETGKRPPDLRLVADLDRVLHGEGRLELLWGNLTGDGDPVWLDDLADLEQKAVSIMETHTVLLPALLQTEAYAKSVIKAMSPDLLPAEVAASVKTRMKRVHRFLASSSPLLWAVLPRHIITLNWGYDGVMAEQLGHVLDLVEKGRVTVQVVDHDGPHAGLVGPFKLITSPAAPDVVYVESAHSGRFIDDPGQVHRFRLTFGAIQAVALSPEHSTEFIRGEWNRKNDD
jgi:transcriptional regulator with XRE-family HTH domain